jgi:CTP synthase
MKFARNVLGLEDANTTENEPETPHPVVHVMPDQVKKLLKRDYGGTMRLGAWEAELKAGSKIRKYYGRERGALGR